MDCRMPEALRIRRVQRAKSSISFDRLKVIFGKQGDALMRIRNKTIFHLGTAGLILVSATLVAQADQTFNFYNFRDSSDTLGSQLYMEVSDAGTSGGTNLVSFKFWNDLGTPGAIPSSICRIYFDGGPFQSIAGITVSGAGVDFTTPTSPPNLPGGNELDPKFAADFAAGAAPAVAHNGLNVAGEWVKITLNLKDGKTYADVLAALASADLRVGLHVLSIGPRGDSATYINGSNGAKIPAPGALVLALVGLGLISRQRVRLI